MFDWIENRLLAKGFKFYITFVPNLQIKPKKTQPENNKCLCRSGRPKGSLKKVLGEISQNSQENICTGIHFWCFLVNFEKFARTPFLQNSTGRLLLIIAVSIVAKGVLANQTVNYETRTKAYVLI